MSLGNALLQPSVFSRDTGDPIQSLVEDVSRLAALFVEDAVAEGPMAAEVQGAVEEVGETVLTWFSAEQDGKTRQNQAVSRLRGRIAPIEAFVSALVNDAGTSDGDPAQIIALIRQLLDLARSAIQLVTLPMIRAELTFIKSIIEDDLGFSPSFINARIIEMLGVLNRRLSDLPTPTDAAARRRINLSRAILARLSLRAQILVPPDFDIEPMARAIHEALDGSGIVDILKEAGCAIDGIEVALNAAIKAGEAVTVIAQPINAGVASKPDAAEYSYYASWLLNDEFIPMLGLSDIENTIEFLTKMKNSENVVIVSLRSQLSESLQGDLNDWDEQTEDEVLRLEVLAAINKEIQRAPILELEEASTLSDSQLSDDIKKLRANYMGDQELFVYNRLVVEMAFGDTLDTFNNGWFWRYVGKYFLNTTGYPRNQVYVTGDRKYVMCDDIPLHCGEGVEWNDAPMFKGPIPGGMWFQFDNISAKFCENWAKYIALGVETAKAIWHTILIQPGHEAQNATVCSIEYADLIQQFLWGKPISAYGLEKGPHLRRWMKTWDGAFGFKGIAMMLSTFQVPQDTGTREWGLFWLTVFGGDFFRTTTPINWSNKAGDIAIGIVTLVNFGGERNGPMFMPSNPSRNHTKQKPFVSLSDTLFLILLVSLYRREIYSIDQWRSGQATTQDDRVEAFAQNWLGGSIGMGLVGGLVGTLVAQIFARSIDPGRMIKTMAWSTARFFTKYWFYNYKYRENATDGGRYTPRSPTVFTGYPSRDTSPYLLPYPGGTCHYAGQGNMGLFSHNRLSNLNGNDQTYAYDFSHDFLEPISCIRSGTIFQIVEGFADGNTVNNNNIIILHDTIDPEHDDYGAGPVRTFARYLHLATNGVTNAPLFGGATPAIGTPVAQGDLIGLAGDTGNSFHNHLHLDVMPETLASVGAATPVIDNFSIPFVFGDDNKGLLPGKGNLKSTSWHRSGNV